MTQTDSRLISWLRTVMAFLVVLTHALPGTDKFTNTSLEFFSSTVYGVAWQVLMPLFFLISGYLFFQSKEPETLRGFGLKLKGKVGRLLIPYLCWLTIGWAVLLATDSIPADFSARGFYRMYWSIETYRELRSWLGYNFPMDDYPGALISMWFVRDLMIVMLLSPLIAWTIRRAGKYAVALIIGLYAVRLGIPVSGFGFHALIFFSLGAALCKRGYSLSKAGSGWIGKAAIFTLIILLCLWVRDFRISGTRDALLEQGITLCGIPAFLYIGRIAAESRNRLNKSICNLAGTSFFIYAIHPLLLPHPVLLSPLKRLPGIASVSAYLLLTVAVFFLAILLYHALGKSAPRLFALLNGQKYLSSRRPAFDKNEDKKNVLKRTPACQ